MTVIFNVCSMDMCAQVDCKVYVSHGLCGFIWFSRLHQYLQMPYVIALCQS